MNATDRFLLQSFKPSLHTNVDCTPLVVAVVSRQVSVVRLLLQVSFHFSTFSIDFIRIWITIMPKVCRSLFVGHYLSL